MYCHFHLPNDIQFKYELMLLLLFVSLLPLVLSGLHLFLLSYCSDVEFSVCHLCSVWMLITPIILKAGNNRFMNVLSLHNKAWQRKEGVLHICIY